MAAVVADTDTQFVTVLDMLLVDAWHSTWVLNPAEQTEDSAGAPVVKPMADSAYGDSGTRQVFA